jgi:hypothetical protein
MFIDYPYAASFCSPDRSKKGLIQQKDTQISQSRFSPVMWSKGGTSIAVCARLRPREGRAMALLGGGEKRAANFHTKRKSWILLGANGGVAGSWVASNGPVESKRLSGVVQEQREEGIPFPAALFVGQPARAYPIAREIPDILDRLYCYCECDKHLGHQTLLSCFADSHAAT